MLFSGVSNPLNPDKYVVTELGKNSLRVVRGSSLAVIRVLRLGDTGDTQSLIAPVRVVEMMGRDEDAE